MKWYIKNVGDYRGFKVSTTFDAFIALAMFAECKTSQAYAETINEEVAVEYVKINDWPPYYILHCGPSVAHIDANTGSIMNVRGYVSSNIMAEIQKTIRGK